MKDKNAVLIQNLIIVILIVITALIYWKIE